MKHTAASIGLTADLLDQEKEKVIQMQKDIVEWSRKTNVYENQCKQEIADK